MIKTPLSQEEMEKLKRESAKFAALCFKDDSLIRAMQWSNLVGVLHQLLIEEINHNFEFPSIVNPNKELK